LINALYVAAQHSEFYPNFVTIKPGV